MKHKKYALLQNSDDGERQENYPTYAVHAAYQEVW